MGTFFIPRNKKIEEVGCNVCGAQLLRDAIGDDAQISGIGCADYVNARTAREYSRKIMAAIETNGYDLKHTEFMHKFSMFFAECSGFWQC